jgi:hypothetical protein
MRKTTWTAIVICGLFVGLASVSANSRGGVLKGIVLDGKGEPVAAARVFLQSADGSAPQAFRTDAQGGFRRVVTRTGLYDVRAEAGGLWSEWVHNVRMKGGEQADITLRLIRTEPPPPLKQQN